VFIVLLCLHEDGRFQVQRHTSRLSLFQELHQSPEIAKLIFRQKLDHTHTIGRIRCLLQKQRLQILFAAYNTTIESLFKEWLLSQNESMVQKSPNANEFLK
jgi:hypothetical protein